MSFWDVLPVAIALMLIFEGFLPFLSPRTWRAVIANVASLDDTSIRRFGLGSMVVGLILLYLSN